MKKKYFRLFTITFGSILLILILANFGINYWLKNNLPDYLRKNTSYKITYQKLDVELLSGNIMAKGITVNNVNPNQNKILGLQGTIDSLEISRLGIYDAIFNKKFSSKNISLVKPILNIVLAARNKDKDNTIKLENVEIKDGKIQVFKANRKKFLGLNSLNLKVTGLELSSDTEEDGFPLGFDTYSIEASQIFYRPDNVYLFLANNITTENGVLNIRRFSFVPLLSYTQFTHYFPEKKNLINLKSSEAVAEGITFKDKKIALKSFRLENPNVKVYTTNAKSEPKKKDLKFEFSLESLILNNALINVEKPDQTPLFTAEKLNLNVNKILVNNETAKESLPFKYENFNIDGKNLGYFTNSEALKIASATLNPQNIHLNYISLKSTQKSADKNYFDASIKSISIKLKELKMVSSKLKLEIDNVSVDEIKGKIATANVKTEKQNTPSFLDLPLKIHKINLKNSDLNVDLKGKPIALNGLNLNIDELELNQNKANQLLLKSGNYDFNLKNFSFVPNQYYKISSNNIRVTKNGGQISNFSMTPLVSRAQYIRMIPVQKDLYDLKAATISFAGNYDLVNPDKFINLSAVTLNNMNANVFRSKIPKNDKTIKPLYSKMLRSVKIPLFINNFDIKNSVLVYEEDIPTSDGPGKILFKPFNLNIKNINSGKMKDKPTQVAITINAGFMDDSPLHINWGFNVLDQSDTFTIAGNVQSLPASSLNPFIEPYLHVTATGLIKRLDFYFKGNPKEISGEMKMHHDHLKIAIMKKNSFEKNKLLSGIANLFIKNSSDQFPPSVTVDDVKRDNTKSFFNLLWKGMENGLAKTLLGANYKKTANTVKNVKSAVKKVVTPQSKDPQKKKSFLERVFN
jgi:hypothetical protein